MERMTALADLDALKSAKPDTSVADGLKEELTAAKSDLEASHSEIKSLRAALDSQAGELEGIKVQLEGKTTEMDTAQTELTAARETVSNIKEELELASKTLEAHKAEAEAKEKTAQADYQDLNDSMTSLVEEFSNKVKDLEVQLAESVKAHQDAQRLVEEAEAKLKVKDAELAEAKVRKPELAIVLFSRRPCANGVDRPTAQPANLRALRPVDLQSQRRVPMARRMTQQRKVRTMTTLPQH
jgi:chromosome segregation ATPase